MPDKRHYVNRRRGLFSIRLRRDPLIGCGAMWARGRYLLVFADWGDRTFSRLIVRPGWHRAR